MAAYLHRRSVVLHVLCLFSNRFQTTMQFRIHTVRALQWSATTATRLRKRVQSWASRQHGTGRSCLDLTSCEQCCDAQRILNEERTLRQKLIQRAIATRPKESVELTDYLRHSVLVEQLERSAIQQTALALSAPTPYSVVTLDYSDRQCDEAVNFGRLIRDSSQSVSVHEAVDSESNNASRNRVASKKFIFAKTRDTRLRFTAWLFAIMAFPGQILTAMVGVRGWLPEPPSHQ